MFKNKVYQAAALTLLCVSIAMAARQAVSAYVSHALNGNTALITCQGTHKVKLTFCTPEIVRVEFDPNGAFTLNTYAPGDTYSPAKRDLATYMMKNTWAPVTYTVADSGTYVKFATSRLTVRIIKSPFRVQFYDATNTTVINSDNAPMECNTGGSAPCDLFISKTKIASERFFGFGNGVRMDTRTIDYTGQDEGQNPPNNAYGSGYDGEHYATPFYFSTAGYGMFVIFDRPFNSSWQMPLRNDHDQTLWDMGKSNANLVTIRWWRYAGYNEYRQHLIYYFIYGPSWKQVIAGYDAISGKPPIMPKWSYGVHINCFAEKFGATPSAKTYEDAMLGFRNGRYPMDAMYLDCDLLTDGRNWGTLNNAIFPGKTWFFNPGTSYWTGAQTKNDTSFLSFARARGVHIGANLHNELCDLKDAPVVKSWVDRGFDIYWRDMTGNGGLHHESKTSYNNFAKAYGDSTKVFVRHGWSQWAAHAYGPHHIGDLNYTHYMVKAQITVGLGGYATTHIDQGVDAWTLIIHSLMAPIFYHPYGSGDDGSRQDVRPWVHPTQVQTNYRTWLGFHYRMMPYLFTYGNHASVDGLPLWRHMMIEDYTNPATYNKEDQAYVGDWLLVAPYNPKVHSGSSRSVYIPKGTWYNFFTGAKYTGETNITENVAGYKLPLYAKAGAIIPMGPNIQYVGEIPEDPITLCVWPLASGTSNFELWEDEKGVKTTFACTQAGKVTTVAIPPFNGSAYSPKTRKYVLEVHNTSATAIAAVQRNTTALAKLASKAAFDAATEGWFYDAANNGVCYVKPNGDAAAGFSVIIADAPVSVSGRAIAPPRSGVVCFRTTTGAVHVSVPFKGNHRVEAFLPSGRLCLKREGSGPADYDLSLPASGKGIYMVKVSSDNGVAYVKKLLN